MQNHPWYPPNTYRVHISASNGYRYQLVTRNAYFDIFWHNRACWPAYYFSQKNHSPPPPPPGIKWSAPKVAAPCNIILLTSVYIYQNKRVQESGYP